MDPKRFPSPEVVAIPQDQICPDCNFANAPKSQVCLACGKDIPLKCPDCKELIELSWLFCGHCGTQLKLKQLEIVSTSIPTAVTGSTASATFEYIIERSLQDKYYVPFIADSEDYKYGWRPRGGSLVMDVRCPKCEGVIYYYEKVGRYICGTCSEQYVKDRIAGRNVLRPDGMKVDPDIIMEMRK
jgi:hypothetical protein